MSKQKGRTNERRVDRLYQQAGYRTYRPENASYGDNDMWNLFDVGAVADSPDSDSQLILTQVKTNTTGGELTAFFDDTRLFTAVSGVTVHFVVVHDGHGGPHAESPACRLAAPLEPAAAGYHWVVDERDEDCDCGELVVAYLRGDADGR